MLKLNGLVKKKNVNEPQVVTKLSLAAILAIAMMTVSPASDFKTQPDEISDEQTCVINSTIVNPEIINVMLSKITESTNVLLKDDTISNLISKDDISITKIRLGVNGDVTSADFNKIFVLDKILRFQETRSFIERSDPLNSYTTLTDLLAFIVLEDYFSYDLYTIGAITSSALDAQTIKFLNSIEDLSEFEIDGITVDSPIDPVLNRLNAKRLLSVFLNSGVISIIPADVIH